MCAWDQIRFMEQRAEWEEAARLALAATDDPASLIRERGLDVLRNDADLNRSAAFLYHLTGIENPSAGQAEAIRLPEEAHERYDGQTDYRFTPLTEA